MKNWRKKSYFVSTLPRMILRPENESLDSPRTFWSPDCKAIGWIFCALEAREDRVGKRFSLIWAFRRDSEEKNLKKMHFSKNIKLFSTCPRMILRSENESLGPPETFWSPDCKAIGCIFRPLEALKGRIGTRFSVILACKRDSGQKI